MGTSACKRVAIIGVTGSIGRSACDVLRRAPAEFDVVALAAGSDVAALARAALEFRPAFVAIADEAGVPPLRAALEGLDVRIAGGAEAVDEVAAFPDADVVVNAAVGAAGLRPTMAAVEAGKSIALANKESLVLGGPLVMRRLSECGATILPIDSEHASLVQCLSGRDESTVNGLVLTASGGPFRERAAADMETLTPGEALDHPTWNMGPRITIDSATLMNKGFEVIEARWLFGVTRDRIRVVVHPQSIIHALVELSDGSMLAHMSEPDMRLPIEFVLRHPAPPTARLKPLSLADVGTLTFEEPDRRRFPCLALAEAALDVGGTMPAVLNAADEVAVGAFLDEKIRFVDIPAVIEATMSEHDVTMELTLPDILETDRWARDVADRHVERFATPHRRRLGA